MNKDKTIGIILLGIVGVSFFLFLAFGKVGSLIMTPVMTTPEYLAQWPSYTYGNIIIQQPSSSIIILALSLLIIALGIRYLIRKNDPFIFWLGVNFIFWGLGALLAGISYQAFGYYLKCSGLTACLFTDWVELLYMSCTVISINAILVAYASQIKTYSKSLALKRFAISSILAYVVFQGIGMLIPVQFLLSYEGLLLFLSPNLVLFIIISYQHKKNKLHGRLFKLWIAFIFVNLAYFVALFADIGTLIMTNTGYWFNENDVLHVLLIVWMLAWWIMIPAKGFKQDKEGSL